MRTPVFLALLAACAPNLGPPASLVTSLRLLAVRGAPPEAAPSGPDAGVTYDLLLVTPQGTVTATTAEWAYCMDPLPPAENNLVNNGCLGDAGVTTLGIGPTATARIPSESCELFGPLSPPEIGDAGPGRPPDPGGTGGYYQPVRVEIPLPDGGLLIGFGDERISCGISGVTIAVASEYAMTYTPNNNPVLAGLSLELDGGAVEPLAAPDAGSPVSVPAGAIVTLSASWPSSSAETFPVLNLQTRQLETERETLTAAWFVTAGSMALDQVAVAGTSAVSSASDTWTAPSNAGVVHVWVVLSDDRGGVDFGEALIQVL